MLCFSLKPIFLFVIPENEEGGRPQILEVCCIRMAGLKLFALRILLYSLKIIKDPRVLYWSIFVVLETKAEK